MSTKMSQEEVNKLPNIFISSSIANDIVFKSLRVYTKSLPHPVPNASINYLSVNDSALDLNGCVDEITFLKEQSVSVLKKYSMLVAYDLLQSGDISEQMILNLEDDQGVRLIQEERSELSDDVSDDKDDTFVEGFIVTEENADDDDSAELEKIEDIGESESATTDDVKANDNELVHKYDKIKLAMARKLVDMIYTEACEARVNARMPWHEKIFIALDLNSIENVQGWLEKLSAAARGFETTNFEDSPKWTIPEDEGLNERRLTTVEIWKEIHTTLVDNLIIDMGVINGLSNNHIINEHNKLNLLSLPHRKAKVKYLIKHMSNMGSTVMYMFGQVLQNNKQEPLGRIVVKRLDDNKVQYNVLKC